MKVPFGLALATLALAQRGESELPKFGDYSAKEWHGETVSLKLTTPSERMFQTRLTDAAKQPPNFAAHYRITYWGCGSVCSAGAMVDLQTGEVIQLPLAKRNGRGWGRWITCPASFEGTGDEFHPESRLIIVRCGQNYSERLQKNVPDVYYFVWEDDHFRKILYISGKASGK